MTAKRAFILTMVLSAAILVGALYLPGQIFPKQLLMLPLLSTVLLSTAVFVYIANPGWLRDLLDPRRTVDAEIDFSGSVAPPPERALAALIGLATWSTVVGAVITASRL